MPNRKILMGMGPTETYPEALEVMASPTVPHYGLDWGQVYNDVCRKLKSVFLTKNSNDVFIVPATGSAVMEMAAAAVIEPGDKVINVVNGFFGERFREIINAYDGRAVDVTAAYGKPVNPEDIRLKLKGDRSIKAIFMIHNESSTTVLNPLKAIGEVAEEFNVLLIADTVSALGGAEFKMDDWNVDISFASSNKALGAPPVLGLIAISENAWEAVKKRKTPIKGWFLNMSNWKYYVENWSSWGHPYPTTTSTPLIMALGKALERVLGEGLDKRFERHRKMALTVREGLKAMNLELLVDDEDASSTGTAFRIPNGIDDKTLRKTVEDKFNILLSGGLGILSGKIVRMGHMAQTASPEYIIPTLSAIEYGLLKQGHKLTPGKGVAKAEEYLLSRK